MLIWSWNHTPEKCASYKKGKRLLTCFGGEKILWRRAANPAQCSPVWMFAAWTGESIERHLPLAWLRAGELVVTWLGLDEHYGLASSLLSLAILVRSWPRTSHLKIGRRGRAGRCRGRGGGRGRHGAGREGGAAEGRQPQVMWGRAARWGGDAAEGQRPRATGSGRVGDE